MQLKSNISLLRRVYFTLTSTLQLKFCMYKLINDLKFNLLKSLWEHKPVILLVEVVVVVVVVEVAVVVVEIMYASKIFPLLSSISL